MPPAWDPPKLLMVVGDLNVVEGTLGVVGVVVDGGIWLLGSSISLRQPGRKEGGKGEKSSREYSSKVLARRSYTTIVCIGIKWKRGYHMWTEL